MHAHRTGYAVAALVASAVLVAVPHPLAAQPPQSPPQESQPQAIKARKDNFKVLSEAMRDLVKGLGDGVPVRAMQPQVAMAQAALARVPNLLPPGSDEGDTKALPRIWTEPERFAATYGAARERMDALGLAAAGDNRDAFGAAVGRMAAACGACHTAFRAR